ncbi:universal stress protein [uncultured Lutibacter sp.]|uniref:universal stress protein n=1 Tax=uncultured Lutibacter sp. TaxID=437739 RepID=UPI0026354B69|nr:universal stress protein [uncultured Lutibacter sp.]
MKNILILTDFSENSWNSITYVLALSQNRSCNFYLLNGVNSYENEFEDQSSNQLLLVKNKNEKDSKKEFAKLKDKINNCPLKGNHNFFPIIADTNIIDAARAQIIEKKINLVVIGTNGMLSNGRQNNISPIAEDIITKLKSSILVVPFEARFKGMKEIVFPTDYTNFSEGKLLQNLSKLISYYQSSTRFVYMAKNSGELDKEQHWNKEALHDYFLDIPHSFHSEINENFELSIENFIQKNNTDLIVMAAKNLNLFEQILFRPKIKDIKYYFKTPFLVLHQFNY